MRQHPNQLAYFVNRETPVSDPRGIDPIIEDGRTIEDAFDEAARRDARAWLNGGRYPAAAVVPNLGRVDFSR